MSVRGTMAFMADADTGGQAWLGKLNELVLTNIVRDISLGMLPSRVHDYFKAGRVRVMGWEARQSAQKAGERKRCGFVDDYD